MGWKKGVYWVFKRTSGSHADFGVYQLAMQTCSNLRFGVLLGVVAASACSLFGDDVDVSLGVHPDTVRIGDTFKAVLVVYNHGDNPIARRGNACLATLAVFRDGEQVPMRGAEPIVCNDVARLYTIPAHDSLVVEFRLVALSWSGGRWAGPVEPPPLGEYTMRARMHVDLPDAGTRFLIRE